MKCVQVDCVVRRGLFEHEHPEVTIVPPANPLRGRWRAVVPLGSVPDAPDTTTVGALDLCHLMDDLYRIFPPDSGG
jgi:hypothetical protein